MQAYIGCVLFFFSFSFLALYYNLFSYIHKASSRLTPYRLKGKKGVHCLDSPYRLKNYGIDKHKRDEYGYGRNRRIKTNL
jgi:hypothetical protein